MVAQFVSALERPISSARLAAYRSPGASDLDMVVNYFFNIELSESLYPSLNAFEIALRNTVHSTLTDHFQTEYWFDRQGLLGSWQVKKIHAARIELTNEGRAHDAGRIVAELNFGFWHSLFNRPFERGLWRWNGGMLLRTAFPSLPRRLRNRQDV